MGRERVGRVARQDVLIAAAGDFHHPFDLGVIARQLLVAERPVGTLAECRFHGEIVRVKPRSLAPPTVRVAAEYRVFHPRLFKRGVVVLGHIYRGVQPAFDNVRMFGDIARLDHKNRKMARQAKQEKHRGKAAAHQHHITLSGDGLLD